MFKIGDFSKIAQISGRMLRHYDNIGLFTPEYIDPSTGYRYYTANQLSRLNRILALKDMGLGLEQIRQLIQDDITPDQIENLLYAQKAQVEQSIMEDVARLRHLEFRIQQLKHSDMTSCDVVVKSVPQQNYFSTRRVTSNKVESKHMMTHVNSVRDTARLTNAPVMVILHNDILDDVMDWELGFVLKDEETRTLIVPDSYQMRLYQLPAVAQMATIIRDETKPMSYIEIFNSLGRWIEGNGYQMAGLVREISIDSEISMTKIPAIYEVQIPIEKASI